MLIKIYNTSKNKLPKYETDEAAGMDIRADFSQINNVKDFKSFGKIEYINGKVSKSIHIKPGSRVLIPTGLHISIPKGYEVQLRPRSGLAIKYGISLVNSPATIDSDYRGNIGIILINHGLEDFTISDGDRIAQMVLNKIETINWEEVDSKECLGNTKRSDNGYSSTGVK